MSFVGAFTDECGIFMVHKCVDGECQCPPGISVCPEASPGVCVDLQSDPENCGACGNACGGGTSCGSGTCVAFAPCGPPGMGVPSDCDGDPANGCETDTAKDPAHCGFCENACAPGAGCADAAAGTCSVPWTCGGMGLAECFSSYDCAADERCGQVQPPAAFELPLPCCEKGPHATGKLGSQCFSGGDCASGVCFFDGTAASFCSDICADAQDCSSKNDKLVVCAEIAGHPGNKFCAAP